MRMHKEDDTINIDQDYLQDNLCKLSNEISNEIDENFSNNKESFLFCIEFDDIKNSSQSNRIYFTWVIYRNVTLSNNTEYSSYFKQKDYLQVQNKVSYLFYSLKNSIVNFFDALNVADINFENIKNHFDDNLIELLVTRILDKKD